MKRTGENARDRLLKTAIIVLSVILVLSVAALVIVYRLGTPGGASDGNQPAENLTADNGADGNPAGEGTDVGQERKKPPTLTPMNLVMGVDQETGRVTDMFIEIFTSSSAEDDLIRIPTDITYIMSADLFNDLKDGNPSMPQTVTLSEVYRYYRSESAYDAARRIVSEMVNNTVLYYTAMDKAALLQLIGTEPDVIGDALLISDGEARSSRYGTEGSTEGFIRDLVSKTETNWDIEDRLYFLDVYDSMSSASVSFMTAPVSRYNEFGELDRTAASKMIFDIVYR